MNRNGENNHSLYFTCLDVTWTIQYYSYGQVTLLTNYTYVGLIFIELLKIESRFTHIPKELFV